MAMSTEEFLTYRREKGKVNYSLRLDSDLVGVFGTSYDLAERYETLGKLIEEHPTSSLRIRGTTKSNIELD